MHVDLAGCRRTLAFAVFVLGIGSQAIAVPVPAITIDNVVGQELANPPFTLGWSFTTSETILLSQLGLFDSGQDGLVQEHDIGVWNAGGVLVASATIGSGLSGTLIEGFRYVDIAEVALSPGSYTIGAVFASENELLIFPGGALGFVASAPITFGSSLFGFDPLGALTLPDQFSGEDGEAYFGPNFTFETGGPIPEPGTLLLIGTGLVGLRRRFRV